MLLRWPSLLYGLRQDMLLRWPSLLYGLRPIRGRESGDSIRFVSQAFGLVESGPCTSQMSPAHYFVDFDQILTVWLLRRHPLGPRTSDLGPRTSDPG